MPKHKHGLNVLDRQEPIELVLDLLSFAAGENTKGTDEELKNNEARTIENWEPLSAGGMVRAKGLTEVANGSGAGYTDAWDLLLQHVEGASTELYGVIEGDIVKKNGALIQQADAAAFTSGVLCHGVSAGDKIWITNSTDNLKFRTIAGGVTVPDDQPALARDRIHEHKSRLVAEGGGVRVYGSKAGAGNWTDADAWSKPNDAYSIDLPFPTRGSVMDFPSSNYTVFTEFAAYELFNAPNIAFREIPRSHGCGAPLSIAKGDEGVFFVSTSPTLGVYLLASFTASLVKRFIQL